MPVPDFQTLMLPLLRFCADGGEHGRHDALPFLAQEFELSESELAELLPSGKQAKFVNRIAWAKSYLKQAGLLETTARGIFRITKLGRAVLAENPVRVDMKYLERFPGYQAFRSGQRLANPQNEAAGNIEQVTPEELLESGYLQIRTALATDLLAQIKLASPSFFERTVVDLLLRMGYGGTREDAGQVVGKSGDGGIDGIIKEDRLGLDAIYIQAKRWEGDVGSAEIRNFIGALSVHKAEKGVFITTSGFSKNARETAAKVNSKIVLIDGPTLAQLMIDFGLGVSTVNTYEIKRIDSDFFAED
jgi:restriction system protein